MKDAKDQGKEAVEILREHHSRWRRRNTLQTIICAENYSFPHFRYKTITVNRIIAIICLFCKHSIGNMSAVITYERYDISVKNRNNFLVSSSHFEWTKTPYDSCMTSRKITNLSLF